MMHDINDIKVQLLDAKKNILQLRNENAALKVNLRKTKDSMSKKEKLIDDLIDPKKPNYFCKELSVRGASLVLKLVEENEQLKRDLHKKEGIIKKLQREIDSIKAYSNISKSTIKLMKNSHDLKSDSNFTIATGKSTTRSVNKLSVRSSKEKLRSFSAADCRTESSLHITIAPKKSQESNFPSPNLSEHINVNSPTKVENIVKSLQNLENFLSTFNPETNRAQIEIYQPSRDEFTEDLPHEEIKQLQNSFKDIIGEVRSLKDSLLEVQKDQQKVFTIMEEKDLNFEKLTKNIQELINDYTVNNLSNKIKCDRLNGFELKKWDGSKKVF